MTLTTERKLELIERAAQGGRKADALEAVTRSRRQFWRAIAAAREAGVTVADLAVYAEMSQAGVRRVLADQSQRAYLQR